MDIDILLAATRQYRG